MAGFWNLGQGGRRREFDELSSDVGAKHVALSAADEQAGVPKPLDGLGEARRELRLVLDHPASLGQDLWVPVPDPATILAAEVVAQSGPIAGSCAVGKIGGDRVCSVGEAGKSVRVLFHEAHDLPPPRGRKRWATSTRTSPEIIAAGDSVMARRLAMPPSEAPITTGSSAIAVISARVSATKSSSA